MNPKAVKALLDTEKLRKSENRQQDIAQAIEDVRASDGYLFGTGGSWGTRHEGGDTSADGVEAAFLKRNPNIKI